MQGQISFLNGRMVVVRPADNAHNVCKMVAVRPANNANHVRRNVFDFMGLPAEIRNMIYECISGGAHKLKGAVAIISVCQQIRREALPILYGDLTLELDLDLERRCGHDKHNNSLYPMQNIPEKYVLLSCGRPTLRKTYKRAGLIGLAGADGALSMLSHLREIYVMLYEVTEEEDTEDKEMFRVHLPRDDSDKAEVDVYHCGRYRESLTGLLMAEVCYWIKRHGYGRFCEELLNRLLEPAKMIQRAMYQEDNP